MDAQLICLANTSHHFSKMSNYLMRRTCADKNDILAFSQYPYANNASIFSRLYLEKCTFLLQTCLFINHYALPDYICTHQQIALLKYEKCKGT